MNPTILLHPNIPKPLHGTNPRTILGHMWWDKQRHQAYKKHGFCCHACGIPVYNAKYSSILEAHECYRIDYKQGTMEFIEIVALCYSCHNYIHSGMLMIAGNVTKEKYIDIIKHGIRLTTPLYAKLIPNPYIVNFSGAHAKWEDWRLVINNKKYTGKFKNFTEWINYYMEEK